jgi:hypothetical protein
VLHQDNVPFVPGRWYRVDCEAIGTTLRVIIDGSVWAEVTDSAIPMGQVGLYCWRSDGVGFDDVEVGTATPMRSVITATVGPPVRVLAVSVRGRGLPYVLALSFGTSPGLAMSQIHANDPRIWPLNADPLFSLSLVPSPALQGFTGSVSPAGEIRASIDAPVVPSLVGMHYFLGGIVVNKALTDVVEILPSLQLPFPG